MKISDIMIRNVKTIQKGKSLREAAKKMVEEKIGSIIVIDKDTNPIGVITRTDVLNHFVSQDVIDPNVPVDMFIKSELISVSVDDQSDIAAELFVKNKLHHR